MAYQEQQAETKRTVVETPKARREVVHSEAVYPDRSGLSGGALAAIVIGVIALAAIVILFVVNKQQDTTNTNVAQSPPQTTVVQQPAQQPPVIVQQPAPVTQQAPVIVNNPGGSNSGNVRDDSAIQAAIDKKLSNDPNLSSLGIVASVVNGKVTLTGTVKTAALKAQVERAVRNLKGVKSIDNQITIR